MAYLGATFNRDDLPVGNGFDPLPAGWYSAFIKEADLVDTKAGNGQYIKTKYEILGPTHKGRMVFGNINIRNPSAKAEEIGRQQLGELMAAIGLPSVQDTDQLIGATCQIKLTIRKDEQYGDLNDVRGWKAIEGSQAPKPNEKNKPSGSSNPPWARK
jgi:hypothetical protein